MQIRQRLQVIERHFLQGLLANRTRVVNRLRRRGARACERTSQRSQHGADSPRRGVRGRAAPRGLTTRGAVAGGVTGLALSVGLLVLSQKVWVGVLGHSRELFPYEYPTLFSLGAALLVAFLVSITDRSARAAQERRAFDAQFLLSERG
jgi:hypothetical protein